MLASNTTWDLSDRSRRDSTVDWPHITGLRPVVRNPALRIEKAEAVRAEVDIADVLDLVVGVAAAERRARSRGVPNQLIAIVLDGLHVR
jgi:hypothetical protein